MVILSKCMLSMLSGLILSIVFAIFLIPILKRKKANQSLSIYLEETHRNKNNTPTMGGLIFILPTLVIILIMIVLKKITPNYNLYIVIFTFIAYALIGFIDDYLIIKKKNNKGLTKNQKLIMQLIIAIIFFYLFMLADNEPLLWIQSLNLKYNVGFIYGLIILLILVSSSNAVNITDGLDGLAGGLSVLSILSFSIIALNTEWLEGYQSIGIFGFTLIGSILGFLMFNISPAKIFMGDTGSLSLGATIGAMSIITRHELLLIIIGIVFVIETITCILQIIVYKTTKKRLFPITPIHHTFEKKGYNERDIVKILWFIGLIGSLIGLTYAVWL